jgi:hypothetical protein
VKGRHKSTTGNTVKCQVVVAVVVVVVVVVVILFVVFLFAVIVTCYSVGQLVEALRNKPEGRGFDSRWSEWNFSVT